MSKRIHAKENTQINNSNYLPYEYKNKQTTVISGNRVPGISKTAKFEAIVISRFTSLCTPIAKLKGSQN